MSDNSGCTGIMVHGCDFGKCVCCGHRVKAGYRFCFGCHRKRMKVYDDCIGAGKSEEWARNKVDAVYPVKFG